MNRKNTITLFIIIIWLICMLFAIIIHTHNIQVMQQEDKYIILLTEEEIIEERCRLYSHYLEYANFDPETGDIVYTKSNISVCEARE